MPTAIVNRGWVAVIRHHCELDGQEQFLCDRLRVYVVGSGTAGKTSLIRAIKANIGRTARIHFRDRSVGIEEHFLQLGDVVVILSDMAGQKEYWALHSAFITTRSFVLLVFRPDEEDLEAKLKVWLELLGAQCPAAHIIPVCTHSNSADMSASGQTLPEVVDSADSAIQKHVARLNEGARAEVGDLKHKQSEVDRKQSEVDAKLLQTQSDDERNALEVEKKVLEDEKRALDERYQQLVDATGQACQLVVEGHVRCVDSVEGKKRSALRFFCKCFTGKGIEEGRGIEELKESMEGVIKELPFMKEEFTKRQMKLKELILETFQKELLVSRSEVLEKLNLPEREWWSGTADKAWDIVKLFAEAGDWKVHDEQLVPNLQLLNGIMKPLCHHSPVEALEQVQKNTTDFTNCDNEFMTRARYDEKLRRDGPKVVEVEGRVRNLEKRSVVHEELLPYLSGWDRLDERKHTAMLKVLGSMGLVAQGKQEARDWFVLARLVAPPLPALSQGAIGTFTATLSLPNRDIPPGLYSRALCWVLADGAGLPVWEWKPEQLEKGVLDAKFETGLRRDGEPQHTLRVCVVNPRSGNESGGQGIQVQCSCVAMLRRVCHDVQLLIRRSFPVLPLKTSLRFWKDGVEHELALPQPKQIDGDLLPSSTLCDLLHKKQWQTLLNAPKVQSSNAQHKLTLRAALGGYMPKFFVSHCWGDESKNMVQKLVGTVEARTKEVVWSDDVEFEAGLGNQQAAFEVRMLEGVRSAQALIILLSRKYLASRNCLLELAACIEEHQKGKHLFVVAVEKECFFRDVRGWKEVPGSTLACDKDGNNIEGVGGSTVKALRESPVFGANIHEHWAKAGDVADLQERALGQEKEQEKALDQEKEQEKALAQEKALEELASILDTETSRTNPTFGGTARRYEVKEKDGTWVLLERA